MSTGVMSMVPEGGLAADRSSHLVATAVFFIILCTIFLILRFVAHHVADSPIFLDDWLIIPAYVLMMGLCTDLILCKSAEHVTEQLNHVVSKNVARHLLMYMMLSRCKSRWRRTA